jgi:hypothetical protein
VYICSFLKFHLYLTFYCIYQLDFVLLVKWGILIHLIFNVNTFIKLFRNNDNSLVFISKIDNLFEI